MVRRDSSAASNARSKRIVSGSPPKRMRDPGAPGVRGTLSMKPTATAMAEAMIAGERAVDSNVHERVAAGNAGADADDCAEGAAERGRGNDPGQSGMRCGAQRQAT